MAADLSHRSSTTRACFLFVLLMAWQGLALAQPVSREDARRAATTFLDNNGASSAELADVSAAAGFDHLYIFTTDHSFVLMAADSRVQPILGYSLKGPFDTENMPDNLRWWLQGYEDGIQAVVDSRSEADPQTAAQWQALVQGQPDAAKTETVVGPLVSTSWGQDSPYNLLCPNSSVTGCVATAMAQILNYWRPITGVGSHSYPWDSQILSADFGATAYDWDNMLDLYGSTANEQQRMAVAMLMYHCGVSTEMKYSPSGSGTTNKRAAVAYQAFFNCDAVYYKRKQYADTVWTAMLKNDLDQQRPIQYGGEGSLGGHSFVCDGYDTDGKFHFNFGWNGSSNGFYTIQGNGFPNKQDAVFHIALLPCEASAPSGLEYTQDGYHVTLSWTGGQDAVSYNVYRNNTLIANTTECSFVDEAGFGDNEYYIRSLDGSDQLSFPSNSINVEIDDYQPPVVDDLAGDYANGAVGLSWSTPWWYPQSVTGNLSYVEKTRPQLDSYLSWTAETLHLFWGIRFSPEDLTGHDGEALYSAAFYVYQPGSYEVLVYQGTNEGLPEVLMTRKLVTTTDYGWIDVKMDEPALLDASLDLWVFILDVGGTVRDVPAFSTDTPHGSYYGGSGGETLIYPHESCYALPSDDYKSDWLIMAYLTDGVYTYNLYRDGTAIANQIGDTQYADSNLENGTYTYFVKTNYNGGEVDASNTITVTVPSIITQDVVFHSGWNWWAPTSEITLTQLEAALGSNGILINSQTSGFVRYESGQWTGTLTDIVPGEMYMIRTAADCTFSLEGIAPSSVTVTLHHGHTWFSYPGAQAAAIATALGSSFTPMEGDKITSQAENFAIYENGAWTGPLTTLQPGHGYIYMSNDTQNKTITF